jgi:hypothetical protein
MFKLSSIRKGHSYGKSVFHQMKKDAPDLYRKLMELSKKKSWSRMQALYHLAFPDVSNICACPDCKKETKFGAWGYRKYCSPKCVAQSPLVRQQARNTSLKNYGTDNPGKAKGVKEKRTKTMLRRFGVRHALQNKDVKSRQEETCLKKFGSTSAYGSELVREKIRQTFNDRYGVDHPMQIQEVKDKTRRTWEKNFGGHPMQNPEFFEQAQKRLYRTKTVTLNGKNFECQGYESIVLDILVKELSIPTKSISTSPQDQPLIRWKDSDGKSHTYFPDIRVRHNNKDICIEVKSLYTVGVRDRRYFEVVKRKTKAAARANVDLRVWVVFPQEKSIVKISEFHKLSFSQLQNKL